MYTKITHHITEEHFGHPTAPHIKKLVDKTILNKIADIKTQEAFKKEISDFYTDYADKISNLYNAVNGTEDDVTAAENGLFTSLDKILTYLRPYYGPEFAENFYQLTRAFALSAVNIVSLLRGGADISNWTNNRVNNIMTNDIAQLLSRHNNYWNQITVKNLWTQIANDWKTQVVATRGKNSEQAKNAAIESKKLLSQFAEIFATGIIQQFPESFVVVSPQVTPV
jgi:hypothetical protein